MMIRVTPGYIDGNRHGKPAWVAEELWMADPTVVVDELEGYTVTLTVGSVDERVGVRHIEVAAPNGALIDANTVRGISFKDAIEAAMLNAVHWSTDGQFGMHPIALLLDQLRQMEPSSTGRYRMPEGDALRALIAVRRAAKLTGIGAQRLFREQLDLPATTARYWVERLKYLGLDD